MDKKKLQEFLVKARTKTYASGGGKVTPAFVGSDQLEYTEDKWLYRDVYYTGNGIFTGLEVIYLGDKPVWTMSYAGSFKKMSGQEIDSILRPALMDNWKTTRLWHEIEWKSGSYKYICTPDSSDGSIDEMTGVEKILRTGEEVYSFYYAGGFIGK